MALFSPSAARGVRRATLAAPALTLQVRRPALFPPSMALRHGALIRVSRSAGDGGSSRLSVRELLRCDPRCPSRASGDVLPRPESASSYHGRPPAIHGRLGAHPPMHATGQNVRGFRHGERGRWSAVVRDGTRWTPRLPHGKRRRFLLKPSPNTLMRRQLRHEGQQRGSRSWSLPRRVWGSSPLTFFPTRRRVGARRGRRGMSRAGHGWPAAGCGSRTRRYPAGHPPVAAAGRVDCPQAEESLRKASLQTRRERLLLECSCVRELLRCALRYPPEMPCSGSGSARARIERVPERATPNPAPPPSARYRAGTGSWRVSACRMRRSSASRVSALSPRKRMR